VYSVQHYYRLSAADHESRTHAARRSCAWGYGRAPAASGAGTAAGAYRWLLPPCSSGADDLWPSWLEQWNMQERGTLIAKTDTF
jgi:hypothetical protein